MGKKMAAVISSLRSAFETGEYSSKSEIKGTKDFGGFFRRANRRRSGQGMK